MNRPKTMKEWGRMDSWKSGFNASSAPCDVKGKNPLVEWARGQGLIVLPQPPLLSINYLNYSIKTLKMLDETREDGKSNKAFPLID